MHTFLVDPRVCLLTGKQLHKGHHSCCGIKYDYNYKISNEEIGLSQDFQYRTKHTQFRLQLMEDNESDIVPLSNFIKFKQFDKSNSTYSFKRMRKRTATERLLSLFVPAKFISTVRSYMLI
jgi:hypothetical protein